MKSTIKFLLFTVIVFTFTSYAFSQVPNYVPISGLVGYWPFNGNANDESGNGNNGIIYANLTSDRFGNPNSAYNFNQGSKIEVPMTQQLFELPVRSFSCWFRLSANQTGGRIYETTFQNGGIGFYAGSMFDTWYGYSQHCCNIVGLSAGPIGVWHHLVVNSNDNTGFTQVYLDGVEISTSNGYPAGNGCFSNTAWQWQGAFMRFGQGASGEAYFGDIDDIAIYNRALTPAEITQLYTDQTSLVEVPCTPFLGEDQTVCAGTSVTLSASGSSLACPPLPSTLQNGLVGYWPFCGNANDLSGNTNNGTVNGATLTNDRFGVANSAYSFDGVNDYINIGNNNIFNLNTMTISLWYNENSLPLAGSAHTMLSKSTSNNGEIGYRLEIAPDGLEYYIQSQLGIITPGAGFITISNVIPNNWSLINIVKSAGTVNVYKNGQNLGVNSNLYSSIINNSNLLFGAVTNQNLVYGFFNGKLDDIGIWNRALTQPEITQLYTTGQATYSWSPGGATTPGITVSPTQTTTYTCTVTINGVSCTDSVTVVVNNPTIDLGSDVTACGTSTTLTAPTGFDSYLWSNGGTTNTTTVSANGTYSCTVTQGGCSASDSIDVTLIDATISASDSVICAGETVTLSVTQGGSSNTACAALPSNLQNGLVGYWPFCGNANDASGNGNTLNEYFVSYDADRFGNPNASFFSNGVELGQGSSMTSSTPIFNIGQSEYTIGLWVKVQNTSQVTRCLFNTIPHTGIAIGYNDNNAPGYVVYDIGPANAFWTNLYLHGPANNYQPNDWHYVVLKKQGINYSQYIDGYLDHSYINPAAANYNYDVNFRISGISPEHQIFHGNIDDIHIYNRALSEAEILQHYNLTVAEITTITYLWSNGATTPTINVSPTSTTTYACTTTTNGLSCTDSVTVVVNNPTIDLGNDVTACGTSTTLTAPAGFDSYLWSNGGTTNTTTVSANGTYTCTVKQGLCSATDSIDVVLVPLTTNTSSASACDSYLWNGTTYTTSGAYTGTTTNCVTESLNLTITPSSTNTTPISACDSYTWNGTTYTSSGVYTGTTTNCVTQSLNLTITPSSTNTTTITACNSYTWNGTTYTASGVYTGTTANCVTQSLNLTITPSSTNTTTAAACNSYTWNGTSYTASGVYTGTTANCVTESLNLTITPSFTNTILVAACGTYTWPNNGQTYTTSGVYTGTTANCVTQSLNLTITPNTSVTTTINANDTYTWAANGITYTASGIYTGPTSANCVTQYLNLTINSSGISEEELVLFSLYPNPVSDMLYVNLNGQDKQDYLIIDNFGAVIKRGVLGNLINEISVSQLSSGLYYFKIEGTKPRKFSKID